VGHGKHANKRKQWPKGVPSLLQGARKNEKINLLNRPVSHNKPRFWRGFLLEEVLPYNGTGTFSRLFSWATDRVNNIRILASRMDSEMDGFATGLSTCITRDGQTTTMARIPFAAGISLSGTSTINPSAVVNVTADGATVVRDLKVILGDHLDVRSFGAGGAGVTDDTAALQAFINHHANATAFISDGTYNITSSLVLPSGTRLVMSSNATITATAAMYAMIMTSGEHRNGLISGGRLLCNPTGGLGNNLAEVGLWLKFGSMIRVQNVEIWDNDQYGILIGDTGDPSNFIYEVFIENCLIRRSLIAMPVNSHGVYWAEGGDCHMSDCIIMGQDFGVGGAIWNTHFDRVHVWTPSENGTGSVGFYIAGNGNTLTQCQIDGPTEYGIQLAGDDNMVVQAKYVMPSDYNGTDNVAYAVWVEPGQRASVTNSFFCGGSALFRIVAGVGGADLSQVTETGNITIFSVDTAIERSRSGARAYVTFAGATPGSFAGMNIASITDNGVGDFTITFLDPMPTTSFTVSATSDWTNGAFTIREAARTQTSVRVEVLDQTGAKVDGVVQVAIHDLH
jgi:hypothetical protein